jgi:hypothetical protein
VRRQCRLDLAELVNPAFGQLYGHRVVRVARARKMKGDPMRQSPIAMILAALVLVSAALAAQVEPAPYITIHYDRIDPAHMSAWEENNKQWVEAFSAAGIGAEMSWRGYQSGFTYAWVSDMPDYAFLDGQEARQKMLQEKLGEGKLAELEAGAAGAIVEHSNEIWKYQSEMSYMPEGFSLAEMAAINVGVVDVKPGMGEKYRALVKEAIEALAKVEAPINFFGYSTPYGEGSYAFVSWAKDRAALHSGPDMGELLTEAVGAEKTQEMYGRYMECVAGEEERDWRVRPDISYLPGEGMAEDAPAKE